MFTDICGGLMPFSFLTAAFAFAVSGLAAGYILAKYQPIPPWNRKPSLQNPTPED